jgi:predicted transcriptional regulator
MSILWHSICLQRMAKPKLDLWIISQDPVNMKNTTVSVDDDVYHRAHFRAAELCTSVSALVRKALQDLAGQETEADRLRRLEADTIERIRKRAGSFSASNRLTREELHDRDGPR